MGRCLSEGRLRRNPAGANDQPDVIERREIAEWIVAQND
jgi:hypothetical protein